MLSASDLQNTRWTLLTSVLDAPLSLHDALAYRTLNNDQYIFLMSKNVSLVHLNRTMATFRGSLELSERIFAPYSKNIVLRCLLRIP